MARYASLLLAPAEGFGLRARAFFALRAKKGLIMRFPPIFSNLLCSVVTLVTFSSNLVVAAVSWLFMQKKSLPRALLDCVVLSY